MFPGRISEPDFGRDYSLAFYPGFDYVSSRLHDLSKIVAAHVNKTRNDSMPEWSWRLQVYGFLGYVPLTHSIRELTSEDRNEGRQMGKGEESHASIPIISTET